MFLNKFKKVISVTLITTTLSSGLFFSGTQKIEAFWGKGDVGVDPANFVQNSTTAFSTYGLNYKEFALDTIAYVAARVVIQKIISSVIEWINTGFDGNPAFITNPDQFMQDIANEAVGKFIEEETSFGFLCDDFSADLKIAITQAYNKEDYSGCTLDDIVGNVDNAMNWDDWGTITINPNGNAYSAYMEANTRLYNKITHEQATANTEIGWGSGYRPLKRTDPETGVSENITPGDAIADQLNENLKLGGRALIQADEINEIVGALVTQIVIKAMSSDGVKGLSESDDGNESFMDQLGFDTDSLNESVNSMMGSADMEGGLNGMLGGFSGIAEGFGDGSEGSFPGIGNMDFSLDGMGKQYISIMHPEIHSLFTVLGVYDEATSTDDNVSYGTVGQPPNETGEGSSSSGSSTCFVMVERELGTDVGRTNGDRLTFRFDKPGAEYCGGGSCKAEVGCADGYRKTYDIPSAGSRYEEGTFLWKPISESDEKLVVLLPSEIGDGDSEQRDTTPTSCDVMVEGEFGWDIGRSNETRPTFRFDYLGRDYCGGGYCEVEVYCEDADPKIYRVPDASSRYEENNGFLWKEKSTTNTLAILLPRILGNFALHSIDGACGEKDGVYESSETAYHYGTMWCDAGKPADVNSEWVFPNKDNNYMVTWKCKGINGGSDASCSAEKQGSGVVIPPYNIIF